MLASAYQSFEICILDRTEESGSVADNSYFLNLSNVLCQLKPGSDSFDGKIFKFNIAKNPGALNGELWAKSPSTPVTRIASS